MPPLPQSQYSWQACLLLFIVSQCSINYFKEERGYGEYKVKVIKIELTFFLAPNNVSMQVRCRKPHWLRRQN